MLVGHARPYAHPTRRGQCGWELPAVGVCLSEAKLWARRPAAPGAGLKRKQIHTQKSEVGPLTSHHIQN